MGPKSKTDYFVLGAKLLLINMNNVIFFSYFRNFIIIKNLAKLFILVDMTN